MASGFWKAKRLPSKKAGRRITIAQRRLSLERLETRALLATDCLGFISGTVALDLNANGTVDASEELADVTIQLVRDSNGNGTYDNGTDSVVDTQITDSNGVYEFDGLTAGGYFVVQPAQPAGVIDLSEVVSNLRTISGAGQPGLSIDDFTTDSGPTVDQAPPGTPVEESHVAPEAIGGERDLSAAFTAGTAGEVTIRTTSGNLLLNPDVLNIGTYTVTWDGPDGTGAGLDPTGLGGIDLTEIGGIPGLGRGLVLNDLFVDQAGAVMRLRVYTDAANFSEAVVTIAPLTVTNLYIPFEGTVEGISFADEGASGGADFTNVGAIELEVQATQIATDGTLNQLGVLGVEPDTVDVINVAPIPGIELEKFTNGFSADNLGDADVPFVNLNETSTVTWTYEVTNTGESPLDAVELTDDQLGMIAATNITDRSINADDILDRR